MTAHFYPYNLKLKTPGGTSRGVLRTKETFILEIEQDGRKGIGECGLFRGLSYDDVPEYEKKLKWLCDHVTSDYLFLKEELKHFPSIWFGYEQAVLNLQHGENLYFPSNFTGGESSIKINGLIWMGDADFMLTQIAKKLEEGFHCIKLKIGSDWPAEKKILEQLRTQFAAKELEIRVDANGAFTFEQTINILEELAALHIHSIEQPIKAGRHEEMRRLCAITPTPIALDEELIGILDSDAKQKLLKTIKPQYIILKPSLVGGISGTDEWISLAEDLGIGWWITSALESNIGLNAIAQFTFTKNPKIPQGLGTGGLFTNNFDSPLYLKGDQMWVKI